MPRDGTSTRDRILEVAYKLVLERGYGGTSVDQIIERAGITKGAFFHHFKTKADLAQVLLRRFAEADRKQYEEAVAQAERLSRDPLQQLLIFVGLLAESAAAIDATEHPGCLYAAYCYQAGLLDEETMRMIRESVEYWRQHVGDRIREVAAAHPPRIAVDADELADGLTSAYEGGFVLARAMNDPQLLAAQVRHYRNYLELLFNPQ